jgi:hypothetical protein
VIEIIQYNIVGFFALVWVCSALVCILLARLTEKDLIIAACLGFLFGVLAVLAYVLAFLVETFSGKKNLPTHPSANG